MLTREIENIIRKSVRISFFTHTKNVQARNERNKNFIRYNVTPKDIQKLMREEGFTYGTAYAETYRINLVREHSEAHSRFMNNEISFHQAVSLAKKYSEKRNPLDIVSMLDALIDLADFEKFPRSQLIEMIEERN